MRTIAELRTDGPPPGVATALPGLLRGDVPADVKALKPGVVHLVGDKVVKLYARSRLRLACFRTPRALKAVRAQRRLLPVHSPEPLHWDRLDDPRFESVLVYRYVAGPTLLDAWRTSNEESLAAIPQFFADLFKTGILHADLHAKNLIWNAPHWYVLDLDGVRHPLHSLRRRPITENTWARLLIDFDGSPSIQETYQQFLHLSGNPWNPTTSWPRIQARYQELLRARAQEHQTPD